MRDPGRSLPAPLGAQDQELVVLVRTPSGVETRCVMPVRVLLAIPRADSRAGLRPR